MRASDVWKVVGPALFMGGSPLDYVVEVARSGGLGTRHRASGRWLPHVMSKVPTDDLIGVLKQMLLSRLASSASVSGVGALPAVSLGVELLSLGVSSWTAWKLHKLDARLAERHDQLDQLVRAGTERIDGLIRDNSALVAVIAAGQGQLLESQQSLRADFTSEMGRLRDALAASDRRDHDLALDQQMRTLMQHHEACAFEMRSGRVPAAIDLERIIAVSVDLTSWLDARVALHPVGSHHRLPLLIAHAFALQLEVDARSIRDLAPLGRTPARDRLRALVTAELRAIVTSSGVWQLAHRDHLVIGQYVYLLRALRSAGTSVTLDDGSTVELHPTSMLDWDDGLGSVRTMHAGPGGTSRSALELTTLAEHSAWQQAARSAPGSLATRIPRHDLQRTLGLPTGADLPDTELRALLVLAPRSAQLAAAIEQEIAA